MKGLPKYLLFLLTLLLVVGLSRNSAYADTATTVNLVDYIANRNWGSPAQDHSLSTGEAIRYTNDGGSNSLGAPVRQWKNSNWEQFFVSDDWIYRREDTSWAACEGGDCACNGTNDKAIYTLDTGGACQYFPGGQGVLTDGAGWAPVGEVVKDYSWAQQGHNIVSIDSGADVGAYNYTNFSSHTQMNPCQVTTGPVTYPVCDVNPGLSITGYYGEHEFEFCSGITNPSPVVQLSGTAGPGSGEGFLYMRDCGLVGFSGMIGGSPYEIGIISGCGVATPDPAVVEANCTGGTTSTNPGGQGAGERITVEGRVRSSFTQQDDRGNLVSGMPIENALVALYQGHPETDSGNLWGRVSRISNSSDSTNKHGDFVAQGLRLYGGASGSFENSNYLMVWCDAPAPVDAWKIDLSELSVRKDFYVPCYGGRILQARSAPESYDLSRLGEKVQCGPLEGSIGIDLDEETVGSSEIAPGYNHPIKLEGEPEDEWTNSQGIDGNTGMSIDVGGSNLPNVIQEPGSGFPGRNDLSGIGWSPDVVVNLAGDYNVGEKHPTRDGDTMEDQLQSCEDIKRCNQIMAGEDARLSNNRNTHTCYSMASRLSDPFMWERLYPMAEARNDPVCVRDDGYVVHFNDIVPPFLDLTDNQIQYYTLPKDYFPYLYLLGNPRTHTESQNWQQATLDTFNSGQVRDNPGGDSVVRQRPYDGQLEADMKTRSVTEQQVSYDPSYGRDTKDTLVSANKASNIGEEKGLAGVLSDYEVPFSYGNPDVVAAGNENIIRVGRGDYQIGRTYELCTANFHDGGGDVSREYYFNELATMCRGADDDPNVDKHPWCSGFKYLSQEEDDDAIAIWLAWLSEVVCQLQIPILAQLLALFEVECIDANEYEDYYARGIDIFWAEFEAPTFESFPNPNIGNNEGRPILSSSCVGWTGGTTDYCDCDAEDVDDCDTTCGDPDPADPDDVYGCNYAPYVCDRVPHPWRDCINTSTWEPCRPQEICDEDPASGCEWLEGVTFDWSTANYTCEGDVYALFSGEKKAFQYAPFERNDTMGVSQIAEALGTPYDIHRECGPLTLTNYEITDQENPDRDTRAFNSGKQGIGCTENTLGRFMMSVADYVPAAGGPSIEPYGTYSVTKTGDPSGQTPGNCNELNCFLPGVDTLEESVSCAAATINSGITASNGATWFVVDKYGPYCDNETKGLPFGHNLFQFFDTYATGSQARTCDTLPPADILPGTENMACPAQSSSERQPGDPAFDYYRGALVSGPGGCPIQNLRWGDSGSPQSMYDQICEGPPIFYGQQLNSDYNCSGGQGSRLWLVLETASSYDVNPWLVLGIWATESWWGTYPACLE